MSELLKGKRALVTGGASGIGLAIGSAFVDAGATVVLADRNPVVATVASEIGSEGVVLDATSESAIVGVVSDMVAQLGGIDILVCSHGILTQAPASEMTSAQWRETIDIDLTLSLIHI